VLITLCLVLGLVIGSFLNVVIWRVPRGESVVSPPSHCPSCDTPIASRDNVPVVSWLLLKGRCRHCQARISARYPLVELATGLLFVGVAVRFGYDLVVPAYLYLAAIAVALTLIDIDVKRLPNALTYPSYPVVLGLLALDGRPHLLLRAALGGAAMLAWYFLLVLVYPAGMGLGDLKLSGVLGMATGYLGWGAWAVGLFGGFLLGGVFSIALVVAGRGGRKTKIPYGPFMLGGALLAVFWGQQLADWYARVTGI
jgi:leader peptidase (prepilin peptidase)/N-methyltransferase